MTNRIPLSEVTVSTRHFEFAHGTAPRGVGHWAFADEDARAAADGSDIFWAPCGTFSAAKTAARAHFAAKGVRRVVVLS